MSDKEHTDSNPRNPYGSFVVTASAGCGKTFQLARRFLCLVSAGEDPATILTVTFTRKAAAEMRERILTDAARLLGGGKDAASFEQEMHAFYQHGRSDAEERAGFSLATPLSAIETGRRVINQSQALRIATIDSIFHDWVAKFPAETGLAGDGLMQSGLRLASEVETREIEEAAWQAANLESLTEAHTVLDTSSDDSNPVTTLSCARDLDRFRNILWLYLSAGHDNAAQEKGTCPEWLWNPAAQDQSTLESELFSALASDWTTLASVLKPERRDELQALAIARDLEGMRSARFISAEFKLNGNTFREKTIAPVVAEKGRIEDALARHRDNLRIAGLLERGAGAARLYLRFRDILAASKRNKGILSFDDLLTGSTRIFSDPYAAGARYLLQHRIRHLMFDEFQDTSWSQWAIFRELAVEILSAATEPVPGTVFLVGDEKQSIYAFRSSDPEVMQQAAVELAHYGVKCSPLNTSFRTSKTVLDYVNRAFDGIIEGFPEHAPAMIDGKAVNPDAAAVTLLPVVDENLVPGLSTVDASVVESSMLAAWLQRAISGEIPHPVYDKTRKAFRPLRAADCAILFRTNHRMVAMERALQKLDIPVMREESRGLLAQQEVRDVMNLAAFFARPDDIHSLIAVLKSPFAAMTDEQVANLIAGGLSSAPAITGLEWLLRHLDHAARMRPSTLLRACLEESSYLVTVKQGGMSDVEWFVVKQHIEALFDLIEDLESNSGQGLHGVVASLAQMSAIEKLHIGSGRDANDVNAVRLMTIHKSKGLEFPLVAIVDSAACWVDHPAGWMKSTSADAKGLIWLGNTDDRPGDDPRFNRWMREAVASEVAEANRLWYVALTRARQYLVLSGQARETAKQLAPLLEGLPLLTHEKLTSALHETSELQTVDLNYVVHSPLASQPDLDIPARLETKVARISRSISGGDKRGTLAAVEEPEQEKHAPRPDTGKVKNAPLLASGVKTLVASRFAAAALDEQETPAVSAPLEGSSRMSSVLAAAFGTFVHATLEHHVQYGRIETFDAQRVWARICSKSMIVAGCAEAQKALAEAIAHAREVVSSPVWTNLLNKLPRKRTEVPVAMLGADATLHQGTMDLVMDDGVEDVVGQRAPTQILVVDYKTSLNGDADESSRKAHEAQVRSYMEFLKGTWPQAKISACLLYTRTMTVREVT